MAPADLTARYTPVVPTALDAPPAPAARPERVPARRIEDGALVEVHLLGGMELDARAALFGRLVHLAPAESSQIIEIAPDGTVVVTHPLGTPDLEAWLDHHAPAPPTSAPGGAAPPGSSTSAISTPPLPPRPTPPPQPPSRPAEPDDPVPVSNDKPIAIEFTRTISRSVRRPAADGGAAPPPSSGTAASSHPIMPSRSGGSAPPLDAPANGQSVRPAAPRGHAAPLGSASISPDAETPPRGVRMPRGFDAPAGAGDTSPAAAPPAAAPPPPPAPRRTAPPEPAAKPSNVVLGLVALALVVIVAVVLLLQRG